MVLEPCRVCERVAAGDVTSWGVAGADEVVNGYRCIEASASGLAADKELDSLEVRAWMTFYFGGTRCRRSL